MSDESRRVRPLGVRILFGVLQTLATALVVFFATLSALSGNPKAIESPRSADSPPRPRDEYRP